MRVAFFTCLALAVACGGNDVTPGDAGVSATSGDGGGSASASCASCGANQVCSGGVCVDLPMHCPCPLGSYCDLASNSCVKGCLGNDHCPSDERCDTTMFQCVLSCDPGKNDCPGHVECNRTLADGSHVCPTCLEAHGDMGATCPCVHPFADCNGDPADGCETPLGTLTDCSACAVPASQQCIADKDQDGYGVSATAKLACGCPGGTIDQRYSKGEDCDDADDRVHPGQTQYFTMPRVSGGFDFDCDNVVEQQWSTPINGKCDADCQDSPWVGSSPACGGSAAAFDCNFPDPTDGTCVVSKSYTRTQGCR